MSKRKRRRDDGSGKEFRIPLGQFPADLDPVAMATRMMHPGVLHGTTDVATVVASLLPGAWTRLVRGVSTCDHDHRDGVIVGLIAESGRAAAAEAWEWIVLDCVSDCEGRSVVLFFDRDGVRDLVNRLNEAVVESERRAAEAAGEGG